MAKYGTLAELFIAIANAVRAKTGSTAAIVADDFPDAIAGISTGADAAEPNLQFKIVSPKADAQVIEPDSGYDGLSRVSILGDSDLVHGNIKSGVTIFGVTGDYTGSSGVSMKSGAVTIDASCESFNIETGLSTVDTVIVVRTAVPSGESGTWGWLKSNAGNMTNCLSYSSTLSWQYGYKSLNVTDNENGSVTVKQHSASYPILSGTYNWIAYGSE